MADKLHRADEDLRRRRDPVPAPGERRRQAAPALTHHHADEGVRSFHRRRHVVVTLLPIHRHHHHPFLRLAAMRTLPLALVLTTTRRLLVHFVFAATLLFFHDGVLIINAAGPTDRQRDIQIHAGRSQQTAGRAAAARGLFFDGALLVMTIVPLPLATEPAEQRQARHAARFLLRNNDSTAGCLSLLAEG
uniref:Uncharacterized protein n=1 Tax=Zea mays TaxID=4577 RepID=C4J6P3_MAIZE|nr:unknown [Zea mays]|eukprot:NP_001183449.1 uncharacterized protein LOC100501880 [Zea mays]